jgi:hypothetical protein
MLSTVPFTEVTWNFLESSHGKGPADGIGAVIKNKADRLVAEGKDVLSAKDLVAHLGNLAKVKLFTIEHSDIDNIDIKTDEIPAIK